MIRVRKASERGHADLGWLDSWHTFSFGGYYDPEHVGFRDLLVINEDVVQPRTGFGTHSHRDMEIVSYVLEGAVEHRDDLGNESVIRAGEVQRMTAGTGIRHSEMNPSETERFHMLQIWILPERKGLEPGYEQRSIAELDTNGPLRLVASPDARDGSMKIHQKVSIHAGSLERGERLIHSLPEGRNAWLQVARGRLSMEGETLTAGDGASVSGVREISLLGDDPAEFLLFDLA